MFCCRFDCFSSQNQKTLGPPWEIPDFKCSPFISSFSGCTWDCNKGVRSQMEFTRMEFYLRQPLLHFLTSWHPRCACACQIGWAEVTSHPWHKAGNSEPFGTKNSALKVFSSTSGPAWSCPAPPGQASPIISFPALMNKKGRGH